MAEKYDPVPDLARLLRSALLWGREEAAHAERIAERLGLGGDDSAGAIADALREALGLKACRRAAGDPAGTVMDLRAREPRTVFRDGDCLVIPALRLDAEGCALLRQVINNEAAGLAAGAELCPGGCGCRLGTGDADRRECGCDGGCCGKDDAEAAPFDNGMHFTESLCPSSLPLAGRSPVPCHLERHHRGPHGSLGEPLQWVGAGDAGRAIEAHRSPVIAERRMREALGYDPHAHLAWYDQKYPLRIDWPPEPHNEAATLAALADYTDGRVTP